MGLEVAKARGGDERPRDGPAHVLDVTEKVDMEYTQHGQEALLENVEGWLPGQQHVLQVPRLVDVDALIQYADMAFRYAAMNGLSLDPRRYVDKAWMDYM